MHNLLFFSIISYASLTHCFYTVDIPSHSIGSTHLRLIKSKTIPNGHSHPFTIQIGGQGTVTFLLLHVSWQLGDLAHSFLTCPSKGQAAIEVTLCNYAHNTKLTKSLELQHYIYTHDRYY